MNYKVYYPSAAVLAFFLHPSQKISNRPI
ncbi:uncharacterized protein FFB14_02603 [Fusarium fujikuroi]|nr:uncharacterized protein FFB14_02603 [Fusarium fujikuroi]